ncbi:epimerase family protein SDR39U1 isoform X2 [Phaenicophaeus curvirostris]|uniref:epimerase family protein SDR39U1 isoform X2 n=1 Tax=Phaenicophaeus curvirostris TaxID=33595 RepID=UPI0037F0AD28
MRVLLGGGSGFVGSALTQLLRSRGHGVTLVSRQGGQDRITWEELSHSGLPLCDAVVNLAGENVLNPFRRWDDAFCREVFNSRIETTKTLAKAIAEAQQPPRAWVVVTGVGVVLGRGGGAISQMIWPFRLGLGGPMGSGLQPFPWIHIQDLAGIVCHALESESLRGILNGVSPSSSTTSNGTFAHELAAALGRPALLPVPAWVVRAVFGAERASMLLEGQRVVPKRTLESGYKFLFPELSGALKDIVA